MAVTLQGSSDFWTGRSGKNLTFLLFFTFLIFLIHIAAPFITFSRLKLKDKEVLEVST